MSDDMQKALEANQQLLETVYRLNTHGSVGEHDWDDGGVGNLIAKRISENRNVLRRAPGPPSRPVSGEAVQQLACETCCGDGYISVYSNAPDEKCPDCEGTGRQGPTLTLQDPSKGGEANSCFKPPFSIYHGANEIGDANGHVCTAENGEMAKELVAKLNAAYPLSPQDGRTDYMPTYGKLPWDQLGRDVKEATTGHRDPFEFRPDGYPGHDMTGINFNSLSRIVDKYRLSAATLPRAERSTADEGK